jgi:diaminohydroxyphosphoribosylaminopyrimidine deaminase / 5-amino-6-(5-phosphoribosylamino)uracil reductase
VVPIRSNAGADGHSPDGRGCADVARPVLPAPEAEGTEVDDTEAMARAITIAERVRRRTPPNPWVGCVLVRNGQVVGEGASFAPGGAHAEAAALTAAADQARGATAYVTLEPCAHQGRTGPCATALIDAGVTRVVVALEDPDPHVQGRGIDTLRAASVTVDIGVGADAARRSLAPYLHHRRTGRAFAVAKLAVSVDGRTAARDGTARWITGAGARHDAHEQRADSQAVVVGAGTAISDQPSLTVRDVANPGPHRPLRVVLDARGRVDTTGPLFDPALAPTLIVTTDAAPTDRVDAWQAAGAKVDVVNAAPDGVDLTETLTRLGGHGVLQALVEGGAILHGALWAAGLVDRLVVYVGATLLGADAHPALVWPGPPTISDAPHLTLTGVTALGDDVRLTYDRDDEAT